METLKLSWLIYFPIVYTYMLKIVQYMCIIFDIQKK